MCVLSGSETDRGFMNVPSRTVGTLQTMGFRV